MQISNIHFNTKDLTGQTFGRLRVVSMSAQRGASGQIKWDCECSCGNVHTVTGESLRSGKSKSCGCLLRECRYAKNDNTDRVASLLRLQYRSIKKRHKKMGDSSFVTSFDEFSLLSFENCFYCGAEPSSKQADVRYENRRGEQAKIIVTDTVIFINGIDRIDSGKGYSTDNVVPCCRHCNTAKNSLSQDKFRLLIVAIYNNWASEAACSRLKAHQAQQTLFAPEMVKPEQAELI